MKTRITEEKDLKEFGYFGNFGKTEIQEAGIYEKREFEMKEM